MNRRGFLGVLAGTCLRPARSPAARYPVKFRKPGPYEALYRHVEPGHDEFPGERQAMEIADRLNRLLTARALPLAANFRGQSPMPARYQPVAAGVSRAEFADAPGSFSEGLARWLDGARALRFYVLPGGAVRFEMSSPRGYHVGRWKLEWSGGQLARFEPLEETVTSSATPFFHDITAHCFGAVSSFREQLLRGIPYWRARLDSACGIDVYGNNGIAVGDIDDDGLDEIYVCQPGGLPNRLYKNRGGGTMEDITERAGVGLLDDTASALFADFRNSGRQDLVVLRASGPVLFLNQGDGTFHKQPDAFRFRTPPQGTFTGMAAADFDRDGRLDLYLCSYVYFQSEDQYRYPAPYHDAQNGPPNFLFRNRADGAFDDVTAEVGLDHNNNRYSFAAAWCDYDGDGWPDLYVANDFGRKNLYKNDHGRFRDIAADAGVEDIGPGMSAAWFDADGDGRPDLYVSNMWSDAGLRITHDPAFALPAGPYRRHSKGNTLYRNRGDGTFEEAAGTEMGRWAWSADGHDFDNDGAPEIYVTCGMLTNPSETDLMSFFWRQVVAKSPPGARAEPAYENGWNAINQLIREDYSWNGREPNVFYARREGRWFDFSGVSGLDFAEDSRAFAVTDLDGDGNLDILLKSRLGPQVRALRNQCGVGRNAIAIRLRGTRSNRDAIGARVDADGQVKFVQAGSGYLSQHTKTVYFGLGDRTQVQDLRITWPSGAAQRFRNLEPGFRYDVTEESAEIRKVAFAARRALPAGLPLQPDNTPRTVDTWLLDPLPLPVDRRGPGLLTIRAVDLEKAADDAAAFALFRRYLFDWRTDLDVPVSFLLDERGLVHKFYPRIPPASQAAQDLRVMNQHAARALPFPGRYESPPSRNYFRLGAAFLNAGYPEPALRYLTETLRLSPDNVVARLAVGQLHLESGRAAAARPHIERALALRPDSAEGWNNLGGIEMAEGRTQAAIRYYEKALELRPKLVHAWLNAAQAHSQLADHTRAEQALTRALEVEPDNPEAANQLGLLLARQGRGADARKWFQKAISVRRDYAGAINNLGVLYMQLGQPGDAVAAFQYGIEVAPQEDILYLNLARIHAQTGERDKAKVVLRLLLDRKPGQKAATRALAELEK